MAIKKSSLSGFLNRSISYVPGTGGGAAAVRVGLNATGGTIEDFVVDGMTYRSHVFTSSGSFVISSFYAANTDCELVVAGGGGSNSSGEYYPQGAAGGGVKYYGSETGCKRTNDGTALTNLAVGTYTVTVGAGGSAGAKATGGTSSFVGTNYNISAAGGFWTSGFGVGEGYFSGTYFYEDGYYWLGGSGSYVDAGGQRNGGGGGGSWPDNGSTQSGGLGCRFRYMRQGGVFLGGGGSGGRQGYGGSRPIATRFAAGFSGGLSGASGLPNSAGGAGGATSVSGFSSSNAGGSGIVIIKYRIY